MIRLNEVEQLGEIKSPEGDIVSLYLDISGTKLETKAHLLLLRDMIDQQKAFLASRLAKREQQEVWKELDHIQDFVVNQYQRGKFQGLVLFSSQAQNLWRCVNLPQPIRSLLAVDHTPYVRPLVGYIRRYRPMGVVHIDRRKARLFEVYMGKIAPKGEIDDEVPAKVRTGSSRGDEGKRIDRHVEDHVKHHFARVADQLMSLFKKEGFEGLVLSGTSKSVAEFEPFLHPYLKERLVGRLELEAQAAPDGILEKVLQIEEQLESKRQERVVQKWIEGVERNALAVAGLRETLNALNKGEVQTLLISDQFRAAGRMCMDCNLLRLDGSVCPSCQKPLEEVPDVVDDAEQIALTQHIDIDHISRNPVLERRGGIGALLRFKK